MSHTVAPSQVDTVLLGEPANDTVTLSSLTGGTYTVGTGLYSNTGPYTISTSAVSAPWMVHSPSTASTRLTLNGEDADIEVNGYSLVDAIKRIEQRLNLLQPNAKLEAEWEQLRELGEQYRALEKKLTEQTEMWNKLRAMPPPDLS